ncbi:hypothetical protein ETSB_1856 [cyanobacterium endosymbiont of Epithemia turgida isolate EtSB Lake Yunoko]|nr:hypothetical protein ETSB_1856 [cyanobacterium endosymbiont of Epithemia turgida isolate EtSB Lake Yunoko]
MAARTLWFALESPGTDQKQKEKLQD